MDDEVAALIVDNGSGMCKSASVASPGKGTAFARVGDDGIVLAIQNFSESPQPASEWKVCKETTKIGFPY